MATNPVLTFHDGKLDVPEELQRDWKLDEGSELRVVSSSPSLILLEPSGKKPSDVNAAMAAWRLLRGKIPFGDSPRARESDRTAPQRCTPPACTP